jgi:hypothetical protein
LVVVGCGGLLLVGWLLIGCLVRRLVGYWLLVIDGWWLVVGGRCLVVVVAVVVVLVVVVGWLVGWLAGWLVVVVLLFVSDPGGSFWVSFLVP